MPNELSDANGGKQADERECPECGWPSSELVDVEQSDTFDHDVVCGICIRDHAKNLAREGERGQGQRPIGEQHAVDRARRCGSGWPR